jgi:tetratricopeptide (TPR) repeat protein
MEIPWLETAGSDALEWVGDRLPMVGTILAGIFPALVVAGLAVAVVWSTRQLVVRYRGRSPRVQITPFTWATSAGGDQEALWITSLFREQLNELKLDSLDAIPDRAPGAPLVQIVEGVGQGVAHGLDIGRAIARLWRAAFPDSAYEVWATLRPLDSGSGGEIAVQLVDRARGNRTLASVISRDADWENSARQAAMAVAGALYPRVANRHTGPWTRWDKAVPPQLIGLYHGALEHESANRLELALGAFREALEMDPLNPNLRIKIAMLEERLDLHLDAWFTYRAIVDEDSRKLWKGPDRRVRLLALYRLAVHLSNREVADQWVDPDRRLQRHRAEDAHDLALRKLRNELILALKSDPLLDVDAGHHPARIAKGRPAELMAALLASRKRDGTQHPRLLYPFEYTSESSEERIRRIHEVLQIVSLRRLEELYAWQRVGPPLRDCKLAEPWIHRRPLVRRLGRAPEFSRMAMRTSMRLVRIRIAASVNLAAKELDGTEQIEIEKVVTEEHRKLTRPWPFPRTRLRQGVARFFRPRLRWIDRRSDAWQLHYNAACAVGSTLLPNSLPLKTAREKEFPRQAVTELEEYAHRAGSERVAGQTDWLVFQDPDLVGLVKTAEFRLWAIPHLALELPEEWPARDVEVRRYTALIVHRGALAFAKSWRDRAGEGSVPITMAIDWWRREKEVWEQISTACHQRRSWRHRLAMLKEMERWSAGNGTVAVDLAHEHRDRSASRKVVPHQLFEQLVTKIQGSEKLPGGAGAAEVLSVQSWVNARVDTVEAAHNENPRGYVSSSGAGLHGAERRAAIAAAQLWTRLAAIMELGLKRELEGKQYKGDDEFDAAWEACLEDFAREVPS